MVQRRTWEAPANSGAFPFGEIGIPFRAQGERALPPVPAGTLPNPRFRDVIIFWVALASLHGCMAAKTKHLWLGRWLDLSGVSAAMMSHAIQRAPSQPISRTSSRRR